jgi:pyocin large subunit-like protein
VDNLGSQLDSAPAAFSEAATAGASAAEETVKAVDGAVTEALEVGARTTADDGAKAVAKATNTPKPGTALEVVPNFADEAKAFEHYAKHSKGVVLRNGKATVKAGGADVPEFATFADYRNAARSFMSGSGGSGTLNGFKDGNLLRFDPSTGYFGVLSNKGVVRTFFRPDDGIAYFYEQFTP